MMDVSMTNVCMLDVCMMDVSMTDVGHTSGWDREAGSCSDPYALIETQGLGSRTGVDMHIARQEMYRIASVMEAPGHKPNMHA